MDAPILFGGGMAGAVYIGHKVPRKEAVKKYKDAVRRVTRRNLPINLEMVIGNLNPIIAREAFLLYIKYNYLLLNLGHGFTLIYADLLN